MAHIISNKERMEKEIVKILIEDKANNKTERETAKAICSLFNVSKCECDECLDCGVRNY